VRKTKKLLSPIVKKSKLTVEGKSFRGQTGKNKKNFTAEVNGRKWQEKLGEGGKSAKVRRHEYLSQPRTASGKRRDG